MQHTTHHVTDPEYKTSKRPNVAWETAWGNAVFHNFGACVALRGEGNGGGKPRMNIFEFQGKTKVGKNSSAAFIDQGVFLGAGQSSRRPPNSGGRTGLMAPWTTKGVKE